MQRRAPRSPRQRRDRQGPDNCGAVLMAEIESNANDSEHADNRRTDAAAVIKNFACTNEHVVRIYNSAGEDFEGTGVSFFIVKPALGNLKLLSRATSTPNAIDQAVSAGDAPRPESRKLAPQRFRAAQSGERVSADIPDEHIDLMCERRFDFPKMPVILQRLSRPDDPQRRRIRLARLRRLAGFSGSCSTP